MLNCACLALVSDQCDSYAAPINCQSCHTSLMGGNPDLIYTRPDRRVTSINGLRNQVTRCKTTVGVAWPEDQVEDVVEYLNTNFYKL